VTAGVTQSAADVLRAAVERWDLGWVNEPRRSGQRLADAARALLDEHEQARDVHAAQLAELTVKTGEVLAQRGEEIAALTAERDMLAGLLRQQTTQHDLDQIRLANERNARDGLADLVQAVRDLATEWILTGEVAAKAYGRAVIARLDGGEQS
jgi:hypothetical protein